jgi:starch phosphorylase
MPVQIQVWKVKVGITPLYLLDTNIPENSSKAREITSVLYGGDKDMRIRQEIVLGIGGVRALTALGITPDIYHSNEGHSWFLALERLQQLMNQQGLSFDEASQYLWTTSVFTTHTPVPAGNERFDPVLVHRYLGQTVRQLGISWNDFLSMGRVRQEDDAEPFNMTVAALKSSAFANGVSRLHGRVSREMWHNIWPNLPREEVPIRAITNGVHPTSWISHDMFELYESYLGPRFTESPADTDIWGKVQRIPEMELWRVHNKRRERLVYFARKRLRAQLERRGVSQLEVQRASQVLDPQLLTIGFARRFSTYKRGNLVFQDVDRLARIVANESRPVQIIISGKAHPLDTPGKEIIKKIIEHAGEPRFRQRVIFLEDYDINIARYLVQGCDVWLNNPRRPQEASGTSGMKAALNGALNLSVLDGWWDEGFTDDVGFRIGNGEEFDNIEVQDRMDAESLYNALENEVVPLFYDRDEIDMPQAWLARMKAAIGMAGTHFSTQRMMKDYAREFYLPAIDAGARLRDNSFALTRDVTAWMSRVSRSWDRITIRKVDIPDLGPTVHVGQKIPVEMDVFLDGITPDDVRVEIISGRLNSQEQLLDFAPAQAELNGAGSDSDSGIFHYFCEVTCHESGRFGITARILPRNENLLHTFKPKLISWW